MQQQRSSATSSPSPPFDLSPPVLRFSSFPLHAPQSLPLTLTNCSPSPLFLSLTPPASHLFTLTGPPILPPSSKLAPGMSLVYSLTFTPTTHCSLDDTVEVRAGPLQWPPQRVCVEVRGEAARLRVRGGEGGVQGWVGGSVPVPLTLENLSPFPVLLSVRSSSPAFQLPSPHLSLAPLAPLSPLLVLFRPTAPGPASATLIFSLSSPSNPSIPSSSLTHSLHADCPDLASLISLSPCSLTLPPTPLTLTSSSTSTLSNRSPHPFTWRCVLPSASSPFTLHPCEGELYPGGVADLTVCFSPPHSSPSPSSPFSATLSLQPSTLTSPLSLHLTGLGIGPTLTLSPSPFVDLGPLPLTFSPVTFPLQLTNEGGIDADWEWGGGEGMGEGGGKGGGSGDWQVDCQGGRLRGGGEAVALRVTFTPRQVGSMLAQLPFLVRHSSPLHLTVKAAIVGPTLSASTRQLQLGLCGVMVGGEGELTVNNDSDVPARVRTALQGDGPFMLHGGGAALIPPHQCWPLRVSYLPTLPTAGREDACELVVDVEGVGERVLRVAVVASACTPPLRLSSSILTLQPHIRHPHTQEVQLHNDSAMPMRVDVLPLPASASSDALEVNPSTLLLPPHSSTALRVSVTPSTLSACAVVVPLLPCGASSPTLLTVRYAALGPSVSLSPSSLSFPAHPCLTSLTLPLQLTNSSPIPARVSPFFHSKVSPFSISPSVPFTVPPQSSLSLSITSLPLEPGLCKSTLSLLVEHADPLTLSLSSHGTGSSILPSLPLQQTLGWDWGVQSTLSPLSRPFHLQNKGRKRHRLTWTHVPFLPPSALLALSRPPRGGLLPPPPSPRTARRLEWESVLRARRASASLHSEQTPTPTPPTTVFRITPAEVSLQGEEGVECALHGWCAGEGEVSERWVCEAEVEGERGGGRVIFDTAFTATFAHPHVSFDVADLAFEWRVRGEQADGERRSGLRLSNPTRLPLTCQLSAPPPFSASPATVQLEPGGEVEVEMAFSPSLSSYQRRSSREAAVLSVRFPPHPQVVFLPLTGVVHFPNLVLPPCITFPCIEQGSTRLTSTLSNPSPLPVHFSWRFSSELRLLSSLPAEGLLPSLTPPAVFDVSPIEGDIPAGGHMAVELLFHAPPLPSSLTSLQLSSVLHCQVQGGPTYPLPLSAAVSALTFELSADELDFGVQLLGEEATLALRVHNRGALPFPLAVRPLQQPFRVDGWTDGVVEGGQLAELRVAYQAEVEGAVEGEVEVRVGYLEPVRVPLRASCTHPTLLVSLASLPSSHGECVYDLSFPPAALGEMQVRGFTISNTSPFPAPLAFDPTPFTNTPFTLSPHPPPILLPSSTFHLALTCQAPHVVQGRRGRAPPPPPEGVFDVLAPFVVHSRSPSLALRVRGAVHRPAVRWAMEELRMPRVRVGQWAVGWVELINDLPIPCDWSAGRPTVAGGKGDGGLRLWPKGGRLEGGQSTTVAVAFEPTAEQQATRVKVGVKAKGGAGSTLIVFTDAWAAAFTVSPTALSLPPLLPHSTSDVVEVTVTNPTSQPLDLFSPLFDSAELNRLALLSSLTSSSTLLLDPRPPPPHPPLPLPPLVLQRLREQRDGFTSPLPSLFDVPVLSSLCLPASLSPLVVNLLLVGVDDDLRAQALWAAVGGAAAELVKGWDDVVGWFRGMDGQRIKEEERVKREEEEREKRLKELARKRDKAKGKKEEEERIAQEEEEERTRVISPSLGFTAAQLQLAASLPSAGHALPAPLLTRMGAEFVRREKFARGLCWAKLASSAVGLEEGVRLWMDVLAEAGGEREHRVYAAVLDDDRCTWDRRLPAKEAPSLDLKKKSAGPTGEDEREAAEERRRVEEFYAIDWAALFGCEGMQPVWEAELGEEEAAWRAAEEAKEADERRRAEERKAEELKAAKPGKKGAANPTPKATAPPPPPSEPGAAPAPAPPALRTSTPSTRPTVSGVKLRRFDCSSSLPRLCAALLAFVKEETFDLFPPSSLPSLTPALALSPPLPSPRVFDVVQLHSAFPTYSLPSSSSLTLTDKGGRAGGRWLLPPQSSLPLRLTHHSTSALGIFSFTLPLHSFPPTPQLPPPLPLSTVVTVPTLAVEMVKGGRGRWSRSQGRFDFGKLIAGSGGGEGQLLSLTNTSPFEVRVELCMKDDTAAGGEDGDEAKAPAPLAKKGGPKLMSPKGKGAKAKAEDEPPHPPVVPVFSTSLPSAVIPVGGKVEVRLHASPAVVGSWADVLVICISDNPIPVLLPLYCNGVKGGLEVKGAGGEVGRVRVGGEGRGEVVIANPSPVPLRFRLTSDLPAWLTLPVTEGEIKAGGALPLPALVKGDSVGELKWEGVMVAMDVTGKVMADLAVLVTASVYQLDVALDWTAMGGVEAVDFGAVRVRGGEKEGVGLGEADAGGDVREVWLDNRGKAEVKWELEVVEGGKLMGRVEAVGNSGKGAVASKGRAVVALRLRVEEAMELRGCADARLLVREKDDDPPLILPIPISFTSTYPTFTLIPTSITLPPIPPSTPSTHTLTLSNPSAFILPFALYSLDPSSPHTKPLVLARLRAEAAAEAAKAAEAAAEAAAPKKGAKTAAPKTAKGAKAMDTPAPLLPTLTLGPLSFTPACGSIAAGSDVTITLRLSSSSPVLVDERVGVWVEGADVGRVRAKEADRRRAREELKRKPWMKGRQAGRGAEDEGEGVVRVKGEVEQGQVSTDWVRVFAGQAMRDRRGMLGEEAEFWLEEATLSFGVARVTAGAAEEATAAGGKGGAKGKVGKVEAKGEAKGEVRTESVRLTNCSRVEATVHLSLTPEPLPPLMGPYLGLPPVDAGPVTSRKGAGAAPSPSPPPSSTPTCGPFSLPQSTLNLPPLSSTLLTLTYSPLCPGESVAHFTALTLHSSAAPLTFRLFGVATPTAISSSLSAVDFERVRVGDRRELTVSLSNPSLLPLRLRCACPPPPFACDWDGRDVLVPAQGAATLPLTFTPATAQPAQGEFTLRSPFVDLALPLTGSGFSQPIVISQGAPLTRVDPLGLVPLVDLGDLPLPSGATAAFRLSNPTAEPYRFVISGVAPPAADTKAAGGGGGKGGKGAPVVAGTEAGGGGGAGEWSFVPAVGHLLPGGSKLVRVSVASAGPKEWKAVKVGVEVVRGKREAAAGEWDDEMRVVRTMSVDEQRKRREEESKEREAEAEVKLAGKGKGAKTPRPPPPLTPPAPITGPVQVSTPLPEPPFTPLDPAVPVPLFVSATLDHPQLTLTPASLTLPPTLLFASSTSTFALINPTLIALPFTVTPPTALHSSSSSISPFNMQPLRGVVPAKGEVRVAVTFAPQGEGLVSGVVRVAGLGVVELSGEGVRPVYHLQLPGAEEGEDGVRLVRVDSVGLHSSTLTQLTVINPGPVELPFSFTCDDPPPSPRILPPVPGAAPLATLTSPTHPFICLNPQGSIAAHKREAITFSFTPPAPSTFFPANPTPTPSLWTFTAGGVSVRVGLIGQLVEPAVELSPSSFAFPTTLVGHTRTGEVLLRNTSKVALQWEGKVVGVGGEGGEVGVRLKQEKGLVAAGEEVKLRLKFRPMEVRPYEARLLLSFAAKRERLYVRMTGDGYELKAEARAEGRKGRKAVGAKVEALEAPGKSEESKEQIRGETGTSRGRSDIQRTG